MIVSLDYDETWTRDPEAWRRVADILKHAGHTVVGMTMRYPHEMFDVDPRYLEACDEVHSTGREAKKEYADRNELRINVWIDDQPNFILFSARPS